MDAEQGWFTLDTSLIQRDLLTVTDKVRETFGLAPAAVPKPAASPESVDQLRRDFNERLEKLEKTVGEVKTARAAPAPLAPAARASTDATCALPAPHRRPARRH